VPIIKALEKSQSLPISSPPKRIQSALGIKESLSLAPSEKKSPRAKKVYSPPSYQPWGGRGTEYFPKKKKKGRTERRYIDDPIARKGRSNARKQEKGRGFRRYSAVNKGRKIVNSRTRQGKKRGRRGAVRRVAAR